MFLYAYRELRNFGDIYGHKLRSFYKHTIILMFDNGTLIITNEFHKASVHVVFVPTFQRDMDHMVITWNVHRACKITKSGSFIPYHVPTQVF
jgi:hypothetical protein